MRASVFGIAGSMRGSPGIVILASVTETARALTDDALVILCAERVEIRLGPANSCSQAAPIRLRFVHEEMLRHNVLGTIGSLRNTEKYAVASQPASPQAQPYQHNTYNRW